MIKKMAKKLKKEAVVKIDGNLLIEVERIINLERNKFRYVNKKHFIDVAVSEYLEKQKKRGKINDIN